MTFEYDANLLQSLRRAVESLVGSQAAFLERLERLDSRVDSLTREHADTLRELAKSRFEAEETLERLRQGAESIASRDPLAPFQPAAPRPSAQKEARTESEISEIDVAGAVANGLGSLIDAATRKRDELDRHIAQLQEALGTVSGATGRRPMRLPVAFEDDLPEPSSARPLERPGTVELAIARPDPESLQRFEEALKRLPGVSDVRVRTAGRDQVVFQVTLR